MLSWRSAPTLTSRQVRGVWLAAYCLCFCWHVQGGSIRHAGRLLHASLGGCFAVPPR
jgi:hypothetical protein